MDERLRQAYAENPGLKILDLRSRTEFHAHRLLGAVNIELADILSYCFLLPHQSAHFIVLVPRPASYSIVADQAESSKTRHAVWLRGHTTVHSWVTQRWKVAELWVDEHDLWRAADQLGLVERGPVDPLLLAKRCLFSPSPTLATAMPEIEAAVAKRGGTQAACLLQEAAVTAECLDVGCGSGRDMMWLAAHCAGSDSDSGSYCRTPGEAQQPGVQWRVTGLDSWAGALERAHDLAAAMQLSPRDVQLVYCNISEKGELQLQQLPPRSRLHSATHATVLAAPPAILRHPAGDDGASGASRAAAQGGVGQAIHLHQQFELIVCVRFLNRALLPRLKHMLKPGGFIVCSTFVDGPGLRAFGRPSGADNVLQPGELGRDFFGPAQGFRVVRDGVVMTEDKRELTDFVAQLLVHADDATC